MLKKILGVLLLLLTGFLSYSHASTTITLDGAANAGYWADDLTTTYFYVKNLDTNAYYYQWRYDNITPLQWGSLNEAITDLNTQGFSWWLESGGDPFNNPSSPIWKSVPLAKGTYEVRLAADSSAYNTTGYWGGNTWNAYVQMYAAYGDSFNFGEGTYSFNTENNALNYYHTNVDGKTFSLNQDANVFFYINDFNSVDNFGSVKLDITVVPEPMSSILFVVGGAALASRGYRRKRH